MPKENNQILSDSEAQQIIMSLANSRGKSGFTEAEAIKVVRWAENAKLQMILLEFVQKGIVDVTVQDGQIAFKQIPVIKNHMKEILKRASRKRES